MGPVFFESSSKTINEAFRIALGDLYGNIRLFRDGILSKEEPVILAGLEYDTPWTRDAAINTWNAAGLLFPKEAKNTLYSVLSQKEEGLRIVGQYWDAIIWVTGAWNYYLYTGDRDFLKQAYEASKNSLYYFEKTEYSAEYRLFSGAACYGDGIAAYDDEFATTNQGNSGITNWWQANPQKLLKSSKENGGIGIPMYALSTNCLYYQAYRIAGMMEAELDLSEKKEWEVKANNLKDAINEHFWNEEKGSYSYYLSPLRENELCDAQEALGLAFAILFHVANEKQSRQILNNAYVSAAGIPCVWPSFSRYSKLGGFGRHSGTVWPHAQGFFADAAKQKNEYEIFWKEMEALTKNICRDRQCAEIYHPLSGEIYGGLQESDGPIQIWHSCDRQTWSASAYLRMVLLDICGMKFTPAGIEFSPCMDERIDSLTLKNIRYRDADITLKVIGRGNKIKAFYLNGTKQDKAFLPADTKGQAVIQIEMEQN